MRCGTFTRSEWRSPTRSAPRRPCRRVCWGCRRSGGSTSTLPRTWSSSATTWRSRACSSAARPVSSLEAVEPAPTGELGTQFLAEIREQPRALEGLLEHTGEFARVAAAARERDTRLVRMVGHGSSDNAASYGVYAFGLLPRLTALRDSISLTVYYGSEVDMAGSLVLGLSQSGRTPDVVEYVARARRAGAFTVAITNDPDSDLAGAAEALLPLGAGEERAVAATKTYLNTLASLVLLAAHMAGEGARCEDDLRGVVDRLHAAVPELEQRIPEVAL